MSMVLPELWANSTRFTITNTRNLLKKHNNLIKFKENSSILEYGFADGSNSRSNLGPLLPPVYKEFIAADISEQMVDYAKKNVNLPKGEFVQLDMAANHLPEQFVNRFDNVFSFFTTYITIAKQTFKNIHASLKPRGETFHLIYKRLPAEFAFEPLTRHPKWAKYGHEIYVVPVKNPNPAEIFRDALQGAGFTDIIVKEEEVIYQFPNEKAWQDLFFSVNPIVLNILPEELEEYKRDYFDEIRRQLLNKNGDTYADGTPADNILFKALIVYGKKI